MWITPSRRVGMITRFNGGTGARSLSFLELHGELIAVFAAILTTSVVTASTLASWRGEAILLEAQKANAAKLLEQKKANAVELLEIDKANAAVLLEIEKTNAAVLLEIEKTNAAAVLLKQEEYHAAMRRLRVNAAQTDKPEE